MKIKTPIITCIALNTSLCLASDNHCDYVVPSSHYLVDGASLQLEPGATICLEQGERGPLRITSLQGTENNPIVIRNENGVVTTRPYEYSIAIENSKHVRLTSVSGQEGNPYGVRLGGTLSIGALSSHVEV